MWLHRILTATNLFRLYRDLIIFGIIRLSHAHVISVNMYHYTSVPTLDPVYNNAIFSTYDAKVMPISKCLLIQHLVCTQEWTQTIKSRATHGDIISAPVLSWSACCSLLPLQDAIRAKKKKGVHYYGVNNHKQKPKSSIFALIPETSYYRKGAIFK